MNDVELKAFIESAISAVVDGVVGARERTGRADGIGSTSHNRIGSQNPNVVQDNMGHVYTIIDFDVAVTATRGVNGEAGVKVLSFGAGGKAVSTHETASRIRLSVPVRVSD